MPKMTEAHKEARIEQIMNAAITSFSKNGFHNTTMSAISKEAGLSVGAVYRYFKSKEDIIAAMATNEREMVVTLFKEIEDLPTVDAMEALGEFFYHTMNQMLVEHGLVNLAINLRAEATRNPKIRKVIIQNFDLITEKLSGSIQKGISEGEIPEEVDPRMVAHLLVAINLGLSDFLGIKPDLDIKAFHEAASFLINNALFPNRKVSPSNPKTKLGEKMKGKGKIGPFSID